jgi:GxxExxY protein
VYHHCLCWELQHANLEFQREVPLAVVYEDIRLNQGFFADIIVARTVLVELKAVERILPVHEAQARSYLRLSGCQVALLMNFNSVLLKDSLRRFIP